MTSIPYIDIHTHQADSDPEILSIVNRSISENKNELDRNQAYSIGIHPWDIEKLEIDSIDNHLKDFSADKSSIAIGEIGLDKLIGTNFSIQEKFFTAQVQLAKLTQKPVIIHCVKSQEELLRIKQENDTGTAWVFHGYNKSLQLAKDLLKFGFFLSFGENLLRNEKLQTVFRDIPLDKIFLETDDKQIDIRKIYQKAAEIKGIEIDVLKEQILLNYLKCF
ncbi:TatD family hydrolase [Marinifilum flexuosum]|uniref:TatD DNase family protein n=1 Tax=Marinifilum flexuosum TaxID=1117708 RepID=A0A419X9Z2_9BACT|nr:TatD family hydrolase [Marinifilum flexuosum]RKE04552.1 TatD DNase family protein [Marinifilum flexuosum]